MTTGKGDLEICMPAPKVPGYLTETHHISKDKSELENATSNSLELNSFYKERMWLQRQQIDRSPLVVEICETYKHRITCIWDIMFLLVNPLQYNVFLSSMLFVFSQKENIVTSWIPFWVNKHTIYFVIGFRYWRMHDYEQSYIQNDGDGDKIYTKQTRKLNPNAVVCNLSIYFVQVIVGV